MAQAYFVKAHERPVRFLISTSLVTLWTGSGVMLSWMEGFRNAYQFPKVWACSGSGSSLSAWWSLPAFP